MNLESSLRRNARKFAPESAVARLHSWLRPRVLHYHIARLLKDSDPYPDGSEKSIDLMNRLVYAWDNPDWSADARYLIECGRQARTATGTVLECGTGLTTLIVASVLQQRGNAKLVSLEHDAGWAASIQTWLSRYDLSSARVITKPLKQYDSYQWYDVSELECDSISLVICDGPPSTTQGGRGGLLWVLLNNLHSNCLILLDDCQRQEEMDILAAWSRRAPLRFAVEGVEKKFARVQLKLGAARSGVAVSSH